MLRRDGTAEGTPWAGFCGRRVECVFDTERPLVTEGDGLRKHVNCCCFCDGPLRGGRSFAASIAGFRRHDTDSASPDGHLGEPVGPQW